MPKVFTTEQFIEKAILIHGNKYDYSKVNYNNSQSKITIICPEHGEFEQIPNSHLRGNGCYVCWNNIIGKSNLSNTEEFIQKAREVHGNKYDYSKVNYINNCTNITIICYTHGEFEQTPANHLQGKSCKYCSIELFSLHHPTKLNQEQFIEKSNKIHNYKYNYFKTIYLGAFDKVTITCPKHGDFNQTPNNHLYKKSGCPKCKKSKGEKALEDIFKKHNIKYIDECKLPYHNFEYDFYLPDYNIFIEFHGIQHYKPIEYFGGVKAFKYTQDCDAKKRSLAREYNIPIIYFTYKHFKLNELKFKEFVIMILNKITKG